MKKFIITIMILSSLIFVFAGCDGTVGNQQVNEKDYTEIKFSDMYETKGTEKNVSTMLQNLDGKKVAIKGYPAVQSPLDESFVYLNNQPYVTCPFCTIGDITKLEVIPIFMADGSTIKYTEDGLQVYGTLEVAEKVDSEGYTTQFRVYADAVSTIENTEADEAVQTYYANLSQQGMIYDLQTLQMNIEYATNPESWNYYGDNNRDILKGITEEYMGFDAQYASMGGSGYTYLVYIMECPGIVRNCAPEDERLLKLNNELIQLYNDQILVLKSYQDISYKYYNKELTDEEVEAALNEYKALNQSNLDLYNRFTTWNNNLRDAD